MPIYDEYYFNTGGDVGGYDNYNENSASSETAIQLAQKFIDKMDEFGIDIVGKKVLDVGCAYGFLVKYLVEKGVDAYGMDFSSYAISQVPPEIQGRIILGNATVEADFIAARNLAGIKGNKKFDLILDQDMIVCLTDAEAITFNTLAKSYGSFVFHYIESSPHIAQWYNYKTMADWKTLLGTGPKEKWFSRFSWLEN